MSRLAPRLEKFAAAFAAAAGFPKNPPLPETTPSPALCSNQTANYAQLNENRSCRIAHFPTSQERKDALNIIRWCMAVAKLPADSPRFAYYVSRWDVPNKIARAIAEGTYYEAVANCQPIDPAWVRFVPAALEAHRQFIAPRQPKADKAKSSGIKARAA